MASVRRDGETTTYEHDGAHQLIGARSDRGDGEAVERRWRYDAAGRLVAESVDGTHSELVYDAAGQLLSRSGADGEVRYSYDGAGRRVRAAESFIVKPNGETVIVPKGAEGPDPVNSGKGFMYTVAAVVMDWPILRLTFASWIPLLTVRTPSLMAMSRTPTVVGRPSILFPVRRSGSPTRCGTGSSVHDPEGSADVAGATIIGRGAGDRRPCRV